ncbi:MAG: bifunctional diaminohydroxyphosphoribosylaminopyrimidine deaminase/5-amino-6-(5-phosphoribosylamino)uracil reductase RibD [Gemmatimonadales bacterium]|nr:MAG: bifunctional diaminohydroxyphosphoribosylaminopyrimidine deaminase/5-amino-6-(5-phosphoribosylamino)uracil reductase RibD [Gemmatimonadales bacterium]
MMWPPGTPPPLSASVPRSRVGADGGPGHELRGQVGEADARHMDRARELAGRGWGTVHPNPMVGCVLVKDGVVVGEGWHARFGGPHAEVQALQVAGEAARGSTAYVSLEPCNHQGKTPPCTGALLEAGVRRVVFGAADPGRRSGGGGESLARGGIQVTGPVLSPEEARRDNPAFFHPDPTRPWTVLKLATGLDGSLTRAPGERTRLTGPEANEKVHRLRAGMDAILVGGRTARFDNPLLTVRGEVAARVPPARVVLDPGPGFEEDARLFGEDAPLWIVVAEEDEAATRRARRWAAAGARILEIPRVRVAGRQEDAGTAAQPPEPPRVDPEALLRRLREEGVAALLCEGGAQLAHSLVEGALVDRLVLITTPHTLGEESVRLPRLPHGRWRAVDRPARLGEDIWTTWDRQGPLRRTSGQD